MDFRVILTSFLLSIAFGQRLDAAVLYSDSTSDQSIVNQRLHVEQTAFSKTGGLIDYWVEFISVNTETEIETVLSDRRFPIILDLTQNAYLSYQIAVLTNKYQKIAISQNSELFGAHFPNVLPGDVTPGTMSSLVVRLLQNFGWTRSTMALSPDEFGFALQDSFEMVKLTGQLEIPVQIFLNNYASSVENRVGQLIKTSGARIMTICATADQTMYFLQAAQAKNIAKAGYGFVACKDSHWWVTDTPPEALPILRNGVLFITEEGTENDKNETQRLTTHLVLNLVRLGNAAIAQGFNNISGALDPTELLKFMKQMYYTPSLELNVPFTILNSQDGVLIPVGTIANELVTITGEIVYPGGVSSSPDNSLATLTIIDTSSYLEYTYDYLAWMFMIQVGAEIATAEVNAIPFIVPQFQFYKPLVNVGVILFDYDYISSAVDQISQIEHIAIVGQHDNNITYVFNQIIHERGIRTNNVHAYCSHQELHDPKVMPRFTRLVSSIQYDAGATVQLFQYFDWSKVSFVYGFVDILIQYKKIIHQVAEAAGTLEINAYQFDVNMESLESVGIEVAWTLDDMMEDIVDSENRIILCFNDNPPLFAMMEWLYDHGYEKGDFIFYLPWLVSQQIVTEPEEQIPKIVYWMVDSISQTTPALVGDVGAQFTETYMGILGFPPAKYPCFEYDGIYLIAHALDTAINAGADFEDADQFNKFMRITSFTGCTGAVLLEQSTNDRRLAEYEITQLSYVEEIKFFDFNRIGTYSSISDELFKFDSFTWPDGSTEPPSDTRTYTSDCPFDMDLVETSEFGTQVAYGVCFGQMAALFGITFLIWRKWYRRPIKPLPRRTPISQSDLMLLITIVVDFMQTISMGPNIADLSPEIKKIGSAFSMNLDDFINLRQGFYWLVFNVLLAFDGLWVFLWLFTVLRIEERFTNSVIVNNLSMLSHTMLPVLGNMFFLPFISIFSDVFICYETIGDDKNDAFMRKDCYEDCWEGKHIIYLGIGAAAIIVYFPIAVYMRPKWQEIQQDLNILTDPKFIMIRSCFQMTIITLKKTIGVKAELAHALVYVCLLCCYAAFAFKVKPYNVERFNLWQYMLLFGTIWVAIISLINMVTSAKLALFIILLIGLALLTGLGFLIMVKLRPSKYPDLLYFPPSHNIAKLIKFQFSNQQAMSLGFMHTLNDIRIYKSSYAKTGNNVTFDENAENSGQRIDAEVSSPCNKPTQVAPTPGEK